MIIYRKGDIIEAFKNEEIDVLVHGCNACGVMGSGIAKQIKEEFPEAFEAYKKYEKDYGLKLGTCSFFRTGPFTTIVNMVTQDKYLPRDQRHFSYDYFDNALQQLRLERGRIGMPKIGAGLGGGNWTVIEAIINSHFKDRDVYIYEL